MSKARLITVLIAGLVSLPAVAQPCEVAPQPKPAPPVRASAAPAASAVSAASAASASAAPGAIGSSAAAVASSTALLVDINCKDGAALAIALRKLKGINEERASAIVRGKPYDKTEELVSRSIIPPSAFESIKPHLVALQPPKLKR